MPDRHRMLPSRAMVVATFAVFLNLAGVGYAATGGKFILGKANTADAPSTLSGSGTGPALGVTSTKSGQPAAAFTVTGTGAPFTVSSSGKVAGLNADQLDGLDSSQLVNGAGSLFTRVADLPNPTTNQVVTVVPSFLNLQLSCSAGDAFLRVANTSAAPMTVIYTLTTNSHVAGSEFTIAAGANHVFPGDLNGALINVSAQGTLGGAPTISSINAGLIYLTSTCHFQVQALTSHS
jgi:hypothetical protein